MLVQTEEEASGQEQIFVEQGEAPGWGQPDGHQVRNEIMVAALVVCFMHVSTAISQYFQTPGERGRENICGDGDGPGLWGG